MLSSLRRFLTPAVLLVALGGAASALAQPTPLTTAFTYQGELASAGTPATGTYDIRFRLFDAASGGNQIGGTLCSDNLAVSAGRFGASLDFGGVFTGQKRFLEIEVRQDAGLDCSDASGYTVLSPRQELTAAPNATYSLTASNATNAASLNGQPASYFTNAANLTGTLGDGQLSSNVARLNGNQTFTGQTTFSNPANTFSGIFSGSGAGLTNLSGGSINAGTLARSSLSADVQSGVGTVAPDLSLAGSVATATSPTSVAVSGSFAYVVNNNLSTLQVFNIGNPAAPTLAGSAATGSSPSSVAVSGSFAYVVNFDSNTLEVFNISSPAAITLSATLATESGPSSVAVSGSFAYVVNIFSNTLQVFNISSPATPTLAGSVATGVGPVSVAVSGSLACVVNADANTLQVFNISNPAAPTLAGSVSTGTYPYSVAVSGSLAYVGNYVSNTLQVFNISNPAAPTLAGSIATGSRPSSVAASGSLAYVANFNSNTLQVFNISNPAAPTLAGSNATGSGPSSVAVSGSLAYVANLNSNTLQVFKALGVGFSTPLAASSLAGVNGSGLTGVNAASFNGQAASFYTSASNITTGTLNPAQVPNLDASKITSGAFAVAQIPNLDASKITSGTLANVRTSGTALSTPDTLVLRDASGNFSAGTITAALSGNAATATLATTATTATSALTATNAALLNNQPPTFYTSAQNITTGTLANARTTGSNLGTPNTLVLRDVSGNFSAGTITAALNGNAATATSATTATTAANATQLNGQAASFYTSASNITTGTLAAAQVPNLDASKITTGTLNTAQVPNLDASKITSGTLAAARLTGVSGAGLTNLDAGSVATGTLPDARLSPNVALLSNAGASQFAGAVGIGIAPTGGARLQVQGYDPVVVDQSQLAAPNVDGSADQWQSFTAALTGRLTGVRLGVASPLYPSSSPGTIHIYAGQGTAGQLLATQQVTYAAVLNQLQQFDLSAPPNVTAGSVYTIRFSAPTMNVGWVNKSYENPYAGGQDSINAIADVVFETLVALSRPSFTVSDSGVSIGGAAPPPSNNGLSVSGASVFAAGVSAASFTGSGAGLTNMNAANITTGTLNPAQVPNLDASKITSGTLPDARLSPNVALLSSGASQFANAVGIGIAPTGGARLQVQGYSPVVVDQSQLAATTFEGSADQWQSFTAARTGRLTGVRLRVSSPLFSGSSPGTIQIYAGQGTAGQLLATQQVTYALVNQLHQFDLSVPPNVTAGSVYTIRFSAPTANNVGWVSTSNRNPYQSGRYSGDSNTDVVFETLVALPGPSSFTVSDSGVSIAGAAGTVRTSAVFSDQVNSTLRIAHPASATVAVGGNVGHTLSLGGFTNDNSFFFPYLTIAANTGNVSIPGSLSKGGGSFKIDHPLDPENKYLYHSFVESPDMKNIYDGVITTDARGFAIVELPDYFEALNRDFRYQLTVVDDSENDFILAKVYREIGVDAPRQFTIKSSVPNIKVSWQVTGIRHDAWAQKNRIPNSVDKPATEKGKLLHPEVFGKPAEKGILSSDPAKAPDAGA